MRTYPLIAVIALFLLPASVSAEPSPDAVAGKRDRSSLDAKIQAKFRTLAKGVDGLSAKLRGVKKSKGSARSARTAAFKKNVLALRSRAKRLRALAAKAKAHPKTLHGLSDLRRHLGHLGSLAGKGLEGRKSLNRAGRLAREVLADKNEVAGLIEPVIRR